MKNLKVRFFKRLKTHTLNAYTVQWYPEIRIMCTCTAKCAHLAPLVNTSNKKHKAFQKVANTYHQVSHYSVTIVTSDLTVFVLGDSFDLRIHGDHKDKLLESI